MPVKDNVSEFISAFIHIQGRRSRPVISSLFIWGWYAQEQVRSKTRNYQTLGVDRSPMTTTNDGLMKQTGIDFALQLLAYMLMLRQFGVYVRGAF